MLLLIDIFSINKGRGYENPSLDIIVIEHYSTGGCPLEEAHEHCFLNQSSISVVLISFMCCCGDYVGYITVILPFLAFHFHSTSFYIWYIALIPIEVVTFSFLVQKRYPFYKEMGGTFLTEKST